ncbi:MAG: hypothetical protein IID14_10190 [Candidatus Marinimicrobia bacterium]|nr:hypothetical protein [Candidatus Neomarinimicrobiota bacterium]
MRAYSTYFICLALLSISCSKDKPLTASDTNGDGAGYLQIQTEKVEYSWSGELETLLRIRTTLTNKSNNTYYSKLGDFFNSSIEQTYLAAAEGSDGYLEKRVSTNDWESMPRGLLSEGVRYVVLHPSQEYYLDVMLRFVENGLTGEFRIRVDYYEQLDSPSEVVPYLDYSHSFTIN